MIVYLCRDREPPSGGGCSKRKSEHSLFSGPPASYRMPSGRLAFVATTRSRYLGTLILPMGEVAALRPGEGRWVELFAR